MSSGLHVLLALAALGSGLTAGVFFAFSSFVMAALTRLPAGQGIAAMQSINVTAVRPVFMSALFGTAAVCLSLTWEALRTWGQPRAALLLTGAALYVIGTAGLTIVHHVPLNDPSVGSTRARPMLPTGGTATPPTGPGGTTYAPEPPWRPRPAFTLALTTRPG